MADFTPLATKIITTHRGGVNYKPRWLRGRLGKAQCQRALEQGFYEEVAVEPTAYNGYSRIAYRRTEKPAPEVEVTLRKYAAWPWDEGDHFRVCSNTLIRTTRLMYGGMLPKGTERTKVLERYIIPERPATLRYFRQEMDRFYIFGQPVQTFNPIFRKHRILGKVPGDIRFLLVVPAVLKVMPDPDPERKRFLPLDDDQQLQMLMDAWDGWLEAGMLYKQRANRLDCLRWFAGEKTKLGIA